MEGARAASPLGPVEPSYARKLLREQMPVVLAGDYNVAPTGLDIYPTTSWNDDALVQPASRAAYARLVRMHSAKRQTAEAAEGLASFAEKRAGRWSAKA